MSLLIWPALVVAGCIYAWFRGGSDTEQDSLDDSSFHLISNSVVSKPSAIYIRLSTDSDIGETADYLHTLGATLLNVIYNQHSLIISWNQDIFIQLCNTQIKEKLGLEYMSALHETVLIQDDSGTCDKEKGSNAASTSI